MQGVPLMEEYRMNVWRFAAANKFVRREEPNPAPQEGKVRVRVTRLMFNGTDALLFGGGTRCRYPMIPGRYAVGLVAEDSAENFLTKGMRVLLHAVVPAPDTGTERKDFSENDHLVCGRTADGYMRDMVYLPPRDMTPLPESVNDEKALLLHHVATAKAAADKLGVRKGQHVAVVGANVLGILLCQLLISRQAAPILIDTERARLDFARTCGVYYTMEADEHLLEKVGSVTGGRLAGGAVYITSARRNDASVTLSVCEEGANVVFCGSREDVNIDLTQAFRKQLSLFCASGRTENLEAAINLLVSGAVDPSRFTFRTVKPEETENLLKDYFSSPARDFQEINTVSLI